MDKKKQSAAKISVLEKDIKLVVNRRKTIKKNGFISREKADEILKQKYGV